MYCKDLLNLSVLSLYEGELLGKVDKLFFDKKLKKLLEIEIIGQEGIRLSLPSKNIYNVGKNAITIKNNQMVTTK
ncbi:MAG: PRC-barrel domain-containing protein, partial [Clostridia bacterium]|nr:PRC-barrel domain-containing protein [Clostridia bacterium]